MDTISKLIRCDGCKLLKDTVALRRLNTSYVSDDSNYVTSCKECYDELYNMYEEQWNDYYRGLL
jgi:hypothetical protein